MTKFFLISQSRNKTLYERSVSLYVKLFLNNSSSLELVRCYFKSFERKFVFSTQVQIPSQIPRLYDRYPWLTGGLRVGYTMNKFLSLSPFLHLFMCNDKWQQRMKKLDYLLNRNCLLNSTGTRSHFKTLNFNFIS